MSLAELCETLEEIITVATTDIHSGAHDIDPKEVSALIQRRDNELIGLYKAILRQNVDRLGSEVGNTICTATYNASFLRWPIEGEQIERCSFGALCVGARYEGSGTDALGPLPSFRPPGSSRTGGPCLLCIRRDTQAMFDRTAMGHATSTAAVPPFCNPVEKPNGYKHEYVVCPHMSSGVSGGAFVRYCPEELELRLDHNNRFYLDERRIRYEPKN